MVITMCQHVFSHFKNDYFQFRFPFNILLSLSHAQSPINKAVSKEWLQGHV